VVGKERSDVPNLAIDDYPARMTAIVFTDFLVVDEFLVVGLLFGSD
jgi:hypothetical protein